MDLEILNDINNLAIQYKAKLLPVIKDKKSEDIKKVYDQGFREFGENRIEQLLEHREKFNDSKFHFIAPLQSRKISQIMENCIYIHTLAREKEAKIINENYSNQKVFVQINIDDDENKSGINPKDVEPFFNMFENFNFFPVGIMCIPSLENNSKISFSKMQKINEKIKKDYKTIEVSFQWGCPMIMK